MESKRYEPSLDNIFPPDPELEEKDVDIYIEMDHALSSQRERQLAEYEAVFSRTEAIERAILYQELNNTAHAIDPTTGETISAEDIHEYLKYLKGEVGTDYP